MTLLIAYLEERLTVLDLMIREASDDAARKIYRELRDSYAADLEKNLARLAAELGPEPKP